MKVEVLLLLEVLVGGLMRGSPWFKRVGGLEMTETRTIDRLMAVMMGNERFRVSGPRGFGAELEIHIMKLDDPSYYNGAVDALKYLAPKAQQVDTDVDRAGNPSVVGLKHEDWPFDITTDAGRDVMELVFDVFYDLNNFVHVVTPWVDWLIQELAEIGLVIVGTGRNPAGVANINWWADKRRYEVLRECLRPGYQEETCETSALQLTIDSRSEEDHLDQLIVGSLIGMIMGAISANSAVFNNGQVHRQQLASRMMTWNRLCPQGGMSRVGVPPTFTTREQYVANMARLPYLFHVYPDMSAEAFGGTLGEAFAYFGDKGESDTQIGNVHNGCIWYGGRWKPYGTPCIEHREPDSQPSFMENVAVMALMLGVAEMAPEIRDAMITHRQPHFWSVYRNLLAHHALSAKFDGYNARKDAEVLLGFARRGLQKRGLNEEHLLDPLDQRVETGILPAHKAIESVVRGGVAGMMSDFQYQTSSVARQMNLRLA